MARSGDRPSNFVAIASGLALTLAGTVVVPSVAQADGPTSFSNTAAIAVPATGAADQVGPAGPYPSTVTVAGMSGTVSRVEVTLFDVTHSVLNDLDVLLVGPSGANVVLVSDLGDDPSGAQWVYANAADLTIADAGAAFPVLQVPSGTYRPTNIDSGGDDTFPAPAPAPSSVTSLAEAFNATDPNGTWSLFVVDDNTGDLGSISGGWGLEVTTVEAAQPGQFSFSAAAYRGVESDGEVEVVVQRTGGSDGAVSVDYATQDGTATSGVDYTSTDGTLTFADGQTSAVISIPVLDDALDLPEVALTVILSAPQGGATIGSRGSTTVILEGDEGTGNSAGVVVPSAGPADPYPSNVHVQGMGTHLVDVDVVLHGLSHSSLADVDVLLVGPTGESVVLLSDVTGSIAAPGVTLTFDDEAGGEISTSPVTGTYRPTNLELLPDAFPGPAPAGPHGSQLSVFDGTDPNGTWRLFVVDAATGDAGELAGWELGLTTASVDAGGPYDIAEGASLTLAGTTDLTGATYAWDLDGDGTADATGPSPTIPAGALEALGLGDGPATRSISLEAGTAEATVTGTATLTVSNLAPTGSLVNDGPVLVGSPAVVTLTGLGDVSAADVAAGLDWSVDLDGDDVTDATGSWGAGEADPTVTVPVGVLDGVGSFVVSAEVTDKDGGVLVLSTTVVVGPTVPTAILTAGPVDEGGVATVAFSEPVDPAPGAVHSYSFDFDGDGVFDVVDQVSPSAQVPAALTADGPATVTVTGRVANQYGGFSDHEATVLVRNAPPSITLTAAPTATTPVGEPFVLEFVVADPSTADAAAGFQVTVDFGDGTVVTSQPGEIGFLARRLLQPFAVAGTHRVSHTYALAGTHDVRVTAVDADGARTEEVMTVVVEAAPTPTPTPTTSPTPTASPTPSVSPTQSASPTTRPTAEPSPTITASATSSPRPSTRPTYSQRPRPGLPSTGA